MKIITKMRLPPMSLALGLVLAGAGTSLAHHGFTGAYDASRPLYLEGVVERATLALPHVELIVDVAQPAPPPQALPRLETLGIPDIAARLRPIEAGRHRIQIAGTNFVAELQGRIKVGDRVALIALRNCRPPHEVRSRWIRLADGDVVARGGATQAEVQGC
ncbi:MAG: hypothetical protein K2Z25_17755 [Beijerinckiaceae bacterium]|nr:hypothetical protein [Beijerinckiaceae bacterium]